MTEFAKTPQERLAERKKVEHFLHKRIAHSFSSQEGLFFCAFFASAC